MDQRRRFQELTRPLRDRLHSMALRYSDQPETAEEWVQETLLRAWRDFGRLADPQAVYAWLLKILDHVIADDTRRQQRRHQLAPVINADDSMLQQHPSATPGPFEETLQQQNRKRIERALMSLPEDFSRAVVLRDMEGLTYQEIAELLSVPKGTVMSRLSRGRRLLAAALLRDQEAATSRHGDSL